jgi:3-isopropylmalate/(R)-2-methylmalate dehydratase small subunit
MNFSSKILVAGRNFGCGSSREHAAWAIYDYGFRVVVSSFFADIFKNNALNNGLLIVQIKQNILDKVFSKLNEDDSISFNVDLITQKFYSDDGIFEEKFEINEYNKTCLLNGYDNIDYLLNNKEKIKKYEEKND